MACHPRTPPHPSLATPARYSAAVAASIRSSGKVVVALLCSSILLRIRTLAEFWFWFLSCRLLVRFGNPIERRVSGGRDERRGLREEGRGGELFCVFCFSVFCALCFRWRRPYTTLCPERVSQLFVTPKTILRYNSREFVAENMDSVLEELLEATE